MMYELLLADDRALLREAFGDADGSHPVFEREAIEQLITYTPDDPEYEDMDLLLQFANMGLLAQMAKDAAPATGETIPVLKALATEEWAEDEIALRLALRRKDITPDHIPELAEGVLLLTTGSHINTDPPCWHILVNGVIEYDLYEDEMAEWIAVLRRMDGERSLGDILRELGLTPSSIRKHLEEAVDYGIICFR